MRRGAVRAGVHGERKRVHAGDHQPRPLYGRHLPTQTPLLPHRRQGRHDLRLDLLTGIRTSGRHRVPGGAGTRRHRKSPDQALLLPELSKDRLDLEREGIPTVSRHRAVLLPAAHHQLRLLSDYAPDMGKQGSRKCSQLT